MERIPSSWLHILLLFILLPASYYESGSLFVMNIVAILGWSLAEILIREIKKLKSSEY